MKPEDHFTRTGELLAPVVVRARMTEQEVKQLFEELADAAARLYLQGVDDGAKQVADHVNRRLDEAQV